jgi:NAD(P)-dependent dehydrogenase (short-subunit alcohol dehydrogenase family)
MSAPDRIAKGAKVETSFRLDGKVAIVTGASRGIGEAIARGFAAAGAQVVIASRKIEELQRVAAAIGGAAHPVACHTGKLSDVQALVAAAVAKFGAVDILVNNAATNPYFGPMIDISDAAFAKTFEVNVQGYFACAREVIRHLRARNAPGSIVNLASVVGMRAAPFQGVYGMTKAAVISMTQTLAFEVGGQNIRVNAIAPGLIETKFAAAIVGNDTLRSAVVDRTPLHRHGQPEEIVGAALYLASGASSFVNGQTLVIDGGMSIA